MQFEIILYYIKNINIKLKKIKKFKNKKNNNKNLIT